MSANIELVIKISESRYRLLQKQARTNLGKEKLDEFAEAVLNGIPLPKGHGRLFDERDIVNGNYKVIGNRIYELEPIIEADTESGSVE